MIDIVEVLRHWHAGRPKSVVASSVGSQRSSAWPNHRSGVCCTTSHRSAAGARLAGDRPVRPLAWAYRATSR